MKKLLALFLSITLLITSMPLSGLADKEYTKNFYILPAEGADETAYRQWAARLVNFYRNSYLDVSSTSGMDEYIFSTSQYDFYELKGSSWKEVKITFDDCFYHPYYTLAERKFAFNTSKDANSQFNGKEIKSTEYTLYDDDELTGLYMWIIQETISEKAELDPDFFTKEVPGNERYYTFSVKSGTLEPDEEMKTLDEMTNSEMWGDIQSLAVSAIDVALSTCIAWNEVKSKAKDAVDDAASVDSYKEFGGKIKKAVLEQAVNFITDSLQDEIDTVQANVHKSFVNIMYAQWTADLFNSMMDCNQNVIDYLRTTYLEAPGLLVEEKFSDVVRQVITTLESNQFQEALETGATKAASENNLMHKLDLNMNNILTKEEVAGEVGWKIVDNLMESVADVLTEMLNAFIEKLVADEESLFKEQASKEGTESKGVEVSIASQVKEFGTECIKEFFRRGKLVLAKVIDSFADNVDKKANNDLGTVFNEAVNEYFIGIGGEGETAIGVFFNNEVMKLVINIFSGAIFASDNKERILEPKEIKEKYENAQKIVGTGFSSYASEEQKTDAMSRALEQFMVSLGSALVKSMKEVINANSKEVPLPNSTLYLLNQTLDELSGCISSSNQGTNSPAQKKMQENEKKEQVVVLIAEVLQLGWELVAEDSYKELGEALKEAVLDSSVLGTIMLNAAKDSFKNVDLMQQVVEPFLKMKVQNSMSDHLKAENLKDELLSRQELSINMEGLSELNSTLKDVSKIIGGVWDSMMDCSASLAKAYESVKSQVTGEHLASLEAERALQTRNQSIDLEDMLLFYTKETNPRYTFYQSEGFTSYDHFLELWSRESRSEKYTNYCKMTAEDILFQVDGQWVVTPDIKAVKQLTDYILTQMHLDCVGMGAYLSVLNHRETYKNTALYKTYFNRGVLCSEQEAQRRYDAIQRNIKKFEAERPPYPLAGN